MFQKFKHVNRKLNENQVRQKFEKLNF